MFDGLVREESQQQLEHNSQTKPSSAFNCLWVQTHWCDQLIETTQLHSLSQQILLHRRETFQSNRKAICHHPITVDEVLSQ